MTHSRGGDQFAAPGGPLTGVRVVALHGMGPTPFACMVLADLGADVVRIVRPPARRSRTLTQADALAPRHDLVNRGVASVAVDLKTPHGTATVRRLVGAAEVFVEGYRPGVAERLGLGPAELLAARPRLVYARLTGYGRYGPLARQAGHDINYVAQSGLLHAMAREGEAPRPPINLLGDYAGGGLMAAFGIVSAVLAARTSGQGQIIDAAMLDGLAVLTARIQGLRASGLFSDVPGTNDLDSGAPFYDTYRCADGRYVAVGALEPDFYAEFLGHLDVDTDGWPAQDDRARWPRLRALIAAALGTRNRDEWAAVFAGTDACVSPVLTFEEAARDRHNVERGVYREIDGVQHPTPAPRFGRTPAREPAHPPAEPVDVTDVLRAWAVDETRERGPACTPAER